jgi:hypothetical protein
LNPYRRRRRKILVYVALVATLAILGYVLATRASALGRPTNDYVQYWAAGRLNLLGLNPYDPEQMLAVESSVGWPLDYPVMPYYLPWVLAIFMPMGLPSYPSSRVLWLAFSLALLLGCATWLWRFYGGSRRGGLWPIAAAGIFAPAILMLVEGQVTPLVLLGVTGFLWFERRQRWLLAGAFAALTAIKPQLLILFWLALLVWMLDRRRWTVLSGAVLAGMTALVAAVVANPGVVGDYFYYLGHYHSPAGSDTATPATILRLLFGADKLWLPFVPFLLGVIWFFLYWRKHRAAWIWGQQMPVLLLASVICAPYAWMHDEVVLLVVVLQAAVWLVCCNRPRVTGIAIVGYLALNAIALALLPTLHYNQRWYVWMPLAFLVGYLVARRYASTGGISQGSST